MLKPWFYWQRWRAILSFVQLLLSVAFLFAVHLLAQDALGTSMPNMDRVTKNENRMTTIENNQTYMDQRLSRIENLGYAVLLASAVQMFDMLVVRRRKP